MARRQLRGKIISFKNEAELFLTAKKQDPKDVARLHSLRRCYKSMVGDLFRPPTEENPDGTGKTRDEILASLEDFRKAMRNDFGNKWSVSAKID